MTSHELAEATLNDPEAARMVAEFLARGEVKIAGAWGNGRRYAVGRGGVAGEVMELVESYAVTTFDPWWHSYHDGTAEEARCIVDGRLLAAGWLLCERQEAR